MDNACEAPGMVKRRSEVDFHSKNRVSTSSRYANESSLSGKGGAA